MRVKPIQKTGSMVSCYPASKVQPHLSMWRGLQAVGAPISASWLHAELNQPGNEPSDDAWSRHWQLCVAEAAAADIVLLYAHPGDRDQMGSLIEAGAALGAGKQVWVVSPHAWSWRHHPRVRNFPTLAAAVSALCALRDGEAAAVSRKFSA